MDGFTIPIGADFSVMQAAVAQIIAAMEQMGDRITAALEQSNQAATQAAAAMAKLHTGSTSMAASATHAGNSAATATGKFLQAAHTAGTMGHTLTGIAEGFKVVNSAARFMSGINLAERIGTWMRASGGLRGALAAIPGVMRSIASNRTFQLVAAGAVTAYAAVLTIRTAFRVVSASMGLLKSAASGVFRGIVTAARSAGRAIGSAFSSIASLPGKVMGSIPGLPLAGILSAAGAMALLVTQLKGASEDAGVFEDMQVTAAHFTGTLEKGNALLADMADLGMKTPFETIDTQLTAVGILTAGIRDNVGGLTRDLAAMARNGEELKELGDAVGKGFAKGKFQTEELNKFLERGINLIPSLQAAVGLTGKAFQQAVENGLSFQQVTTAIHAMSQAGGQFFGLLEKRSQTFGGLVSTLVSGWTDLRKAFGTPINDALKPILQMGIEKMESLLTKAKELGEKMGNAISVGFEAFKSGEVVNLLKTGLAVAFQGAIDILTRGFRGAVAFLAATLPPVISAAFAKVQDGKFWQGIANVFQGIGIGLAAEIKSALPLPNMQEIAGMRKKAGLYTDIGNLQMSMAGNVNVGEVISKAMVEGMARFKDAASGPSSDAFKSSVAEMNRLLAKLQGAVDADKIFGDLFKSPLGNAIPPSNLSPSETVGKAVAPAVMSLTRIGGGGFANTVMNSQLAESRKHTALLQKIQRSLEQPAKSITAKYT